MTISPSKNDLEKDKFVETMSGETAVRVQICDAAEIETMALSPSVNDREKAKFVETMTGETAVRVTIDNPEDIVGILAENVVVTPTGDLTSTNVQAALEELQSEIVGGGGAVSSVFGRTGVITAQSGDYSASQITNFDEAAQDAIGAMIADTTSINLTYTDATPELKAEVLPGGVDHDALLNFVANEHIDHSSITVTGTGALGGGGDLTASRTISHNTAGVAGTYGSSTTSPQLTTDSYGHVTGVTDIPIDHDALSNFVSNEHVNHSSVTVTGTGALGGGGDLTASRTISHNTAGTAGTYGSASQIPVLTTDSYGHVTAVTNTSVAISGSAVSNTPAGNILSTTVQAAIDELDAQKQPLDSTLTSLAAYNTNGILTQTSANNFTGRTITGTASQITVANGDGVSGNPTISLPAIITASTVGSANGIPNITYDATGRITSTATNSVNITSSNVSNFSTAAVLAAQSGCTGFANNLTMVGTVFTGASGSIHSSAQLQADSTTKGFLLPRMTNTEMNAITSPATGLQIYNTTNSAVYWYNGTAWTKVVCEINATAFSSTVYTGSASINSSAQLQADSTTKGFLPPRMTTSQKAAISSPATGLMVYDTDFNQPFVYNGSAWVSMPTVRKAASAIASAQSTTTITVGSMQFRYSSNATGGGLDIRSNTASARSTWVSGERRWSFATPAVGTQVNALVYPNAVSGAWTTINVGGMDGSSNALLHIYDLDSPYQIWRIDLRNLVDVVIFLTVEVV